MKRNEFIKNMIGAFIGIGNLSFMTKNVSKNNEEHTDSGEFVSFGTIHLNNTNIEKAIDFWTRIIGMKLRRYTTKLAEFGTNEKALIIVHQSADMPFKEGYSGLYHFAIHTPDNHSFAKMLYRLTVHEYSFSPIDHTMSKSLYLEDPDGIQIEITLETPERFKRVITEKGLYVETTDGTVRSASERLDTNEVLKDLKDKNIRTIVPEETKIGHIHFYATDVNRMNAFYKNIGLEEFNYLPAFRYADLGAGGLYKHRVAMNSWHGANKPLAPKNHAGLKHFHLIYQSKEKLTAALKTIPEHAENDSGYWMEDPTGNKIFLTYIN